LKIYCFRRSYRKLFFHVSYQDRTACVWRLPDLVSVVVFKGHKRGIWSVEFSPVDQCVVTASGDKTIRIWAISDGSCLKTFEGHTSSVLRALFVTRGTQIVSCGMGLSVADFVIFLHFDCVFDHLN
jgi:WD40 repeat protein